MFVQEQHAVMMKRRNQRSSELFIGGGAISKSDAIGKASQSSEYEAAMAAAALMERPPEESSMKSLEATNNLVATALLMKYPNRTSTRKDSSNMIASVLARRQGSSSKWHQSLGVAIQADSLEVQSNKPVTQDRREHLPADADQTLSMVTESMQTGTDSENNPAIKEIQPINATLQMEPTGRRLEKGAIEQDNNENEANGVRGQESRTQVTHMMTPDVTTSTSTIKDQARQQQLSPQSIVGQGQQGRLRVRNN